MPVGATPPWAAFVKCADGGASPLFFPEAADGNALAAMRMCFSAEASFAAAAALLPVGAYCVKAAVAKQPRWLPVAVVPLVFAIQQFSEGLVWVGLRHGHETLTQAGALIFLFFALAFWPFWSGFAMWVQETDPRRRRLLLGLALLGTVWLWAFYLPLAAEAPALLTVSEHAGSVRYYYRELPVLRVLPVAASEVFYLLLVAVPLFVATGKRGRVPALALAVTAGVTAWFFQHTFVSVWCFFAAVMALALAWLFHVLPPRPGPAPDVVG
jgi:hypothetical protein